MKFEEDEFYPSIKQRQFTGINFLSYIGGTLGLFAGFSVLTVFELLSHFVVRSCLGFVEKMRNRSKVHAIKTASIIKSKKHSKLPGFIKIPLMLGRNYAENSSVHGITHASQKNLSIFERYGNVLISGLVTSGAAK